SAFRCGGAGAGIHGAGAIRTATDTVMAIRMATVTVPPTATATVMVMEATDTATPATVMRTALVIALVIDTATAATPEWLSYSVGSLVPVITMGPLTVSWDRRRVEQFARTSRITDTQASDPVLPGRLVRAGGSSIIFG